MVQQRRGRMAVTRFLSAAIIVAIAALLSHGGSAGANPLQRDLFDDIYARGRGIETSLKTVTARFTETTTSSLLTRPLVAHGTLAVQRPSKIVLHYDEPEVRTMLIDRAPGGLRWCQSVNRFRKGSGSSIYGSGARPCCCRRCA